MLENFSFDFVSHRKIAYIISFLIIFIGIISLTIKGGPKLSTEFTGGTFVQLSFNESIENINIENGLKEVGLLPFNIQKSFVNNDISFKLKESDHIDKNKFNEIKKVLNKDFNIEKVEIVGPSVGVWLIKRAIIAFFFAFLGIIIYVGIRFSAGFWGLAGVLALIHDVLIVISFFSVFNIEIDLTIIAALMTIVGYSINDTIVIYDRIRENMRTRYKENFIKIMNDSIKETLSRTILTTLTTLFSVICILLFGGDSLRFFSLALFIGFIAGTYSSIFIAIPIVIDLDRNKKINSK